MGYIMCFFIISIIKPITVLIRFFIKIIIFLIKNLCVQFQFLFLVIYF